MDLDVDVEPPDWDEEACEEAEATADEIAEHDPEAAAHLYAQLAAVRRARQREQGGVTSLLVPSTLPVRGKSSASYDPMRLYAQLAHYYHFGDREIDEMHFPRVFAYYREAVLMQEEEQAAHEAAMKRAQRDARRDARRGHSATASDAADTDATLASIPRPRPYDGPVVRLVD